MNTVAANNDMDQWLNQKLNELLPSKIQDIEAGKTPSMAIIATKGTLDWAYPPFILASTSAALGWDTSIFFTFYGLLLLKNCPWVLRIQENLIPRRQRRQHPHQSQGLLKKSMERLVLNICNHLKQHLTFLVAVFLGSLTQGQFLLYLNLTITIYSVL